MTIMTSNQNIDFYRRVVFTGLSRMSDDLTTIKMGFNYWEQNLSDQAVNVIEVTEKLVAYLGLDDGKKKRLLIGMQAAINKLPESLPEIPGAILDKNTDATAKTIIAPEPVVTFTGPAHCIVTGKYLKLLFQHLVEVDILASQDLIEALSNDDFPDLPREINSIIHLWGESGGVTLDLPHGISEAQCAEIAHEVYLLIAEIIGPSDADEIVNQAIVGASRESSAREFHPRNLL